VLAVDVDSRERADIPPFGYQIDYLTFGGIYREWRFAWCGDFYRKHFCETQGCFGRISRVEVDCFVRHLEELHEPLTLEVELHDGKSGGRESHGQGSASAATTESVAQQRGAGKPGTVKLWDLANPNLYSVHVVWCMGPSCGP